VLKSIEEYCGVIQDNTVFWCMGDKTAIPLAMNWVENCNQLGVPLLFVALDLSSYNAMQLRVPTVYIPGDQHHVFVYKFIVGQQILKLGFNWFYTDVDCVAQSDYTPVIRKMFEQGADQICQAVKHYRWLGDPIEQHGEYNCGTGMYGMRATDTNISICEVDYLYSNGYKEVGTCQAFANSNIKHRPDTQIKLLDPRYFPEGNSYEFADSDWKIFHITGKYAYENWDNSQQYLGDEAKIASLKKLGYWYT
tara:strand:- start:223 stop:972 length:750 start_codon:yes stop_codon:yes gene_type:complete